jgi:protein subunit release factor A
MTSTIEEDVHVRVIDQRIGQGVGGMDTVIRAYHVPTGILVEVPRGNRSPYYDRQVALEMIEYALASGLWPTETEEETHG